MKLLTLVVLLAVAACAFADAASEAKRDSAPKVGERVTGELQKGRGSVGPGSRGRPGGGSGCTLIEAIRCKLCGGVCANGKCPCSVEITVPCLPAFEDCPFISVSQNDSS